jgi:long-chain acyl-CoA synthetase
MKEKIPRSIQFLLCRELVNFLFELGRTRNTNALNISTPLNAFLHWESANPDKVFLRQPVDGIWMEQTYRQAGTAARKVANVLSRLLPAGSKVAILSKNCAEWLIADLAIMMANHISVPIYPTLSAESIKPLLIHSESKLIFIGKLDAFETQRAGIPDSLTKISFDAYGVDEGLRLSNLIEQEHEIPDFSAPAPESLATIMYSSGTTGTPKGVMLTHGAFGFVGEKVAKHLGIVKPERFFSYLPLSHIAERALMEMVVFASGSAISFTESLEKFAQNLQQEQPTIFGGVPRIYSKFQEGVLRKIPEKKLRKLLSIPLVNTLIKKSIQKKLGLSKARVIVSGAAPTPITLLYWFKSLGITVREIYGMTENTAFSHANFRKVKIGTVGEPWPETECRLNDDGEILLRHPALMTGYFKDAETTSSVFTSDGFLKTGDKGEIDEDGFLTITGRVKDQFKTDKAKFIGPAQIELKILSNTDIEQACVVGIGLPQPIALVVPSAIGLAKPRDEFKDSLTDTLSRVNETLESYERLQKIVVMKDSWSIDNGMLTPSLKLKRAELEKKNLPYYSLWFKDADDILWQK